LNNGFDAEIRREIQPQIPETFYKMLQEEYRKAGKPPLKFTLEQAVELFELLFVEQTAMIMIFGAYICEGLTENPKLIQAKREKMELRARLCVEDALEIIDRRNLDGFALKQ
jgi:hypothetical protein